MCWKRSCKQNNRTFVCETDQKKQGAPYPGKSEILQIRWEISQIRWEFSRSDGKSPPDCHVLSERKNTTRWKTIFLGILTLEVLVTRCRFREGDRTGAYERENSDHVEISRSDQMSCETDQTKCRISGRGTGSGNFRNFIGTNIPWSSCFWFASTRSS